MRKQTFPRLKHSVALLLNLKVADRLLEAVLRAFE
jgi:hypothetical protein